MEKINDILVDVKNEDIEMLKKKPKKFWKGVTSIGPSAFQGCESLTNIIIPEGVTSIGMDAFNGCKSLTNITIPEGVTSIGKYTFNGCESITNIIIPEGVTSIGEFAFNGCKSLTNITIPEGVTSIGKYTFGGCKSLTNITIPEDVTSIGDFDFSGCESLTNITIPVGVTSIGEFAFEGCKSLTNITIPEDVTSIGSSAFKGCESLTNITIPEGVTSIGSSAFEGCESLTNITFGKTLRLNAALLGSVCSQNRQKDFFENIPQKQINNLVKLHDQDLSETNEFDFYNLCFVLGAFEPSERTMKIDSKDVPVKDVAFTFLQNAKNNGMLEFESMHMNFQALKPNGFSESFLRFASNKLNWTEICQSPNILPRIYDWYQERERLNINEVTDEFLPRTEEDRFKLRVIKTTERGIDKLKWLSPTVELFKNEFQEKKFNNIRTPRDIDIAHEIGQHLIYEQRHFDKAKEIDEERKNNKVENVLKKPVSQGRIASLEEYKKKTKAFNDHILQTSAELLAKEKEDTSHIFTYDMLDKSDPVNFAIGCYTSCCAQLYGAGAGAMRAMIIHPDIQPLAIRNFNKKIVSFGIIYVNRDKNYAVINDFEVNKSYSNDSQRKAIYDKAMQGVDAFVKEYNHENPDNPIKKVTCGCSPNWKAINDFIQNNPKSEILDAPNFDDFKYTGSGSWPGDWHKQQYVVWEGKNNEPSL